ncbi:hypothetical protein M501DRAFT_1055439 [Patellaria atrata CBS 101060]|uniref:Bilirubin oxidase n=1 Tax=Patellaria atrata CBS 101060 TaxID=1346257 RepID=A0A9P4SEY6_9PEZI|nr:hypothetical protein M501DRAFT_1055439 [Patellaria atrata CBS 101060]
MAFLRLLSFVLYSLPLAFAGDDDWESPVYNYLFEFPLPIPSTLAPLTTYTNPNTSVPIDFYEIKIQPFQRRQYPNLGLANLVGYNGQAPGPTIRVTRGRETVVRFINQQTRPSSIHLHGSASRAAWDGWAEDVLEPGQYKDYYYPNTQAARTLWYHDHAEGITAVNAYQGQAGFYIIDDPVDAALGLPSGQYDIPLALNAKFYKSNGDLLSIAGEEDEWWGDVIEVNGQPWPYLAVEPRKYRFRLLDAAADRSFSLSLMNGNTKVPFTVIGSDSGLLSQSVSTNNLRIAMAERWEIIVDFAPFAGKNLTLTNARDVFKDEDYFGTDRVMRFKVGNAVSSTANNGPVPTNLANLHLPPVQRTAVDRSFLFEHTNSEWRINGVGFADVANRILARPQRGKVELWKLENGSGGWSHPIHIHLVDFQIKSRVGGRNAVSAYEQKALKDVVSLGPNEAVTVLMQFQPHHGVYMFHCHNLVHEDHDMMAAFNVTQLQNFQYDTQDLLIDPMEPRWRAQPYPGTTNLQQVRDVVLPRFAATGAYANLEEIEAELNQVHGYAKREVSRKIRAERREGRERLRRSVVEG